MTFCGTFEYMAPEVLTYKSYDYAVDLWAIGILLYELLTGNTPFSGEITDSKKDRQYHLIRIKPKYISPEAHSLIGGLLESEPSNRLGMGYKAYEEIRQHEFFTRPVKKGGSVFVFEDVLSLRIQSPWVPNLDGPRDLKYFGKVCKEC